MRRVGVFQHLVHSGRGHGPIGVLLSGAQPGHLGGLVLRGGDRRPKAALDGRGLGVVREEAALRVSVGGGHRRVPCRVEEARQGQADREVVRPDHLGVRHAAGPDALPQRPRQEGLVDQEGVHPVLGRVERGSHVLQTACRGPPETTGFPARSEVLRGRVGGGIHVDVGVAGNDHRMPPTEAAGRGIHLYVGPEGRPPRPWRAACLRSVDVDEGEATPVRADIQGRGLPGTIAVKLSTSCSATYLLLTAVRRPPPLEVEVAPVSASQLLKNEVYPLSQRAAATCISCARVAIPVSWRMLAKPPSWGSMPVTRCSLLVQAAEPRRRRSVSQRDRSSGTRPFRRFQERSHRASSAASSWSQLSRIGIAAGSAAAARSAGCAGAMGC